MVHNPPRALLQTAELDELPFATEVYEKNLKIENYNVPFLLNPYVSFYTARGCPALCTFCPVSYTHLDVYKRQLSFAQAHPTNRQLLCNLFAAHQLNGARPGNSLCKRCAPIKCAPC